MNNEAHWLISGNLVMLIEFYHVDKNEPTF